MNDGRHPQEATRTFIPDPHPSFLATLWSIGASPRRKRQVLTPPNRRPAKRNFSLKYDPLVADRSVRPAAQEGSESPPRNDELPTPTTRRPAIAAQVRRDKTFQHSSLGDYGRCSVGVKAPRVGGPPPGDRPEPGR